MFVCAISIAIQLVADAVWILAEIPNAILPTPKEESSTKMSRQDSKRIIEENLTRLMGESG